MTITEPAVLVSAAVVDSNVTCNGFADGGATASATGGTMPYTFTWSNGAVTPSITGVIAGTYSVTVTDANGCTDSSSVTITEPTLLVSAAVVDSNVTCNSFLDGGATASATGGTGAYTYTWSNGATTASITGVGAGTYSVTVTDANGCTDSSSVVITEPALLVATTVVDSNISCNGFSDGGATASATGGTMPYTYNWSNAATTASITGVVAGTYSVTITDANGCTDSTSVTITEPAVLIAAGVVDSNVSCNGFADGGATASATGGTMPYTYNWSNAATTASITGVVAGTYSVTITDANGCTDSTSVTITEPALLVSSAVVDSNVTCNGFADGGATASAIGGTGAYTYTWSNGATTASITGVLAGTYSVTVTDANGCTDSSSVTITEPTLLISLAVVDSNVSCNGFADGGATASATGGTGAYTYSWSNGATTASITGVLAGTYSVTVTDANGCTDSSSVIITEPAVLVAVGVVDSNVSCNAFADGGATASATGGTMPYTYIWSNAATTASITGVVAGTYSVTITDANGCTDSASVTITEPALLVSSIGNVVDVLCNGDSTGSAIASATGGTAPYTYLWSNGTAIDTINTIPAGTYTVTVTDANGCTDTSTVTILEPSTPVASTIVSIVDVNCPGDTTGMAVAAGSGGVGPYSYLWSSGDIIDTANNLADGTYFVTVTDANGCTVIDTAVVGANNVLPSIFLGNDTALCDDTLQLDAGAGFVSYLWNLGDTTQTFTVNVTGTYSVVVTDNNGCSGTDSIVVDVHPLPTVNLGNDTTVCGGITLDAGAGIASYLWSTTDTTQTLLVTASNTYSVMVTDTNGCSNNDTIVVTVNPLPVVNLGNDTSVCDPITLDAGSGLSGYLWSTGDTTSSILATNTSAYTVTVTDGNGCTNIDTINVTVFPGISATINTIDATCTSSDGEASISVAPGTGPYTFAWSNGVIDSVNTNIPSGTYTVTVTDANGCTLVDTANVINGNAPVLTLTGNDVSCNDAGDGAVSVSLAGGNAPFTFAWNNGETTQNLTGLSGGVYVVTVSDTAGCVEVDSFTVFEPTAIVLSAATVMANCGVNDGEASIAATGGVGPYSYQWNDPSNQTTDTATALFAGVYTVTVTDALGCTNTETMGVSNIGAPILTISGSDVTCEGGNDGQATVIATGAGPFSFQWNDTASQTTDTAFALPAGTYFVQVTDGVGCIGIDSITINFINPLPVVNLGNDTAICEGEVLTLDPGPFAAYWWSNNTFNQTLDVDTAGQYWVAVTDANTCINTDTINVVVNALPTVDLGPDTSACGVYTLDAGAGFNVYDWSNGDTTQTSDITIFGTNTYSVTVTDGNGCTNSDTADVNIFPSPVVDLGGSDTICENFVYIIDAGGGFDTYLWTTGDTTQTISVSTPGTYGVIVTDFNGCTGGDTLILVSDPCVSVSEPTSDVNIKYYPNPTRGMLNMNIIGMAGEDAVLEVMTIEGQVVQSQRLNGLPENYQGQIDLSVQAQGIYLIKITTAKRSYVSRISVQ